MTNDLLPTETSTFLNTLFGSYEGEITFDLNEEIITTDDLEFIKENVLLLRAFAETPAGVFFVYRVTEDINNTVLFAKAPTLTLFRDQTRIDCWAFNSPVERTDPRFEELLNTYEIDNAVPLPGVDGWDMTKCDTELAYDLSDLLPAKAKEIVKFNDAKIVNKFSPEKYEDQEITVTLGKNSKSMAWGPITMPLVGLLNMLTEHKVGEKDGLSVVFADMAPGQRLKNAVKTVTAITLDIDTGTPTEEIDAALGKLNCLAVRYTTHSSGKMKSYFKKDHVSRSFPDVEIDTDLMKRYCSEIKNFHESIVETIEYEGIEHTSEGIQAVVTHRKMPKNRVVVPTSTPYEIATEGKTQMEAMARWAKYPAALADLLGVPFDRACTDPSRVFYLPRHDKSRGCNASIFGGKLFDRNSLQLDDKFDAIGEMLAQKGGKSKTEEGKALGRWSMTTAHGFQIANVLEDHCEDRLRGKASNGFNIECPFDEGHSNAGATSDRACFAVNAADGGNELFIISCRHGSCQDYTNIDMLGKMIKDKWFSKKVLEDRTYNILAIEGEKTLPKTRQFVGTPSIIDLKLDENIPQFAKALLVLQAANLGLAYDELGQREVLRANELPWTVDLGREVNDDTLRVIRHYVYEQTGKVFSKEDIFEAAKTLAQQKRFNPICEYLDGITWDGKPRVDQWLSQYLGAEDGEYTRAVGSKILIGAVSRARHPGVKFDTVAILEGPQGTRKSTAVRIMGVNWFSDADLGRLDDKDSSIALQGVWIQELGELTAMKRSEVEDLKAFVSRQEDRFRAPFDKVFKTEPRRCIFIGTTNQSLYLVDSTGNRRYWPVKTGTIDIDALARDRDQLWAEAAHLEAQGVSLILPEHLWSVAALEQAERQVDDPWVDELRSWLDAENRDRVHTRDLLMKALLLDLGQCNPGTAKRLRQAMVVIGGWTGKRALRIGSVSAAGYERVQAPNQGPLV